MRIRIRLIRLWFLTQVAPFKVEQSHGWMGNYYRAALPITHSDIHIPDPHSIGFIGKDANSASGGRMLSGGDGLMMFIIICLSYVVFITYHNMFNIFYHKILLCYDVHMIHIFDRMSCTLGTLAS